MEVLGLARLRSMPANEVCQVFSETARALLGPEERYRIPTPLELELCMLPRRVLDTLSTGAEAARAVLCPHLDRTAVGRLPAGAELLQVSCQRISSTAFETVASEAAERRAGLLAEQIAAADRAAPDLGQRWYVNLRLRDRALPRPWPIISGYDGRAVNRQTIGRRMRREANATIASLYDAVHSADSILQLYDASPARRERYYFALAERLVSLHGNESG